MMLRLSNISHSFGATRVLDECSLEVAAGERVHLSGDNGSGKTTLLRICGGLIRPDSGDRTFAGSAIGWLGHRNGLTESLNCEDNIRVSSGVVGATPDSIAQTVTRLGLDPQDQRPIAAWSFGMRRRLAVAVAVSSREDLVLLDEPFAGLDPKAGALLEEVLSHISAALIVVSHTSPQVGGYRSLHLSEGKLR